ncbi:unnamed protein product [Cylindrotheca closterium]|uniref:Uncharacterized protein n=1 Tax=Cylindrotheca closterium TaxID=2856 RepID=A0AAD2CFH8_9STRA|nr:unnamed protein product [Cylindrotheca closterium]
MSLQTPTMQVYPFHNEDSDIEDAGIIDLHRSDSSVYSEQPEPWVCKNCSYVNVDGRNIFCAMCGAKNENKFRDEANAADSMDSVSEYGLVNSDVRLLGNNSGEEGFRSFQRALSVPALNLSGQRPGMEDDDSDGEAQPLKPSTGQSAYLYRQGAASNGLEFIPNTPQSDDSSVMNGSVCSSVATQASMSSTMANSVASSTAMTGSVASSTATPRMSNKKHLASAMLSSDRQMQSDISVASSAVTEKASNRLPMSVPLDTTDEEINAPWDVYGDRAHDGNIQTLKSMPTNPDITQPRMIKSGIYSIDEEQNAIVPPFMRALSMPMRPQESDALSTISEPQKPIRTKDWDPLPAESVDLESNPISVRHRKESESSHYTESTAGRTSTMSSYNDEPSPKSDDPQTIMMPRATVVPLRQNRSPEGGNDEDRRDEVNEKERRVAMYLFGAGSLVVLISFVLMVTLIPSNTQNADFNLPSFAFTTPPSGPDMVVGNSSANFVQTQIPSPAPTQSPVLTAPPTTTVPTEDNGAFLLGELEGVEDSRRIGHSVSLGGIDGDVVAFVGAGTVGISKFDTRHGNWSSIETIDSLESIIPETAKVSLSTEMDRLALAYNGKLEVHEYSASNVEWIRRLVLYDGLAEFTITHTVLSMAGDGMFVAFLQPDLGLQMIDVRTWTSYPVSTTPNLAILQVEVSLNGKIMAVLTENGVELKVPDPSGVWGDLVEPVTDVKRATAIALSGNGETLVVTSRTQTVVYSLNAGDDATSTFTITQGGIALSIDYDGQLLGMGMSNDMLNADQTFTTVSLYRRSTGEQPPTFEYEFLEDIQLGDTSGASLSLLTTKSTVENSTKIAVGAPLDGRKQQGSVRLYQVQHFSIK